MINRKRAVVLAATFSALVVVALAVATARAANSPVKAFVPNTRAQVQAVVAQMAKLHPYFQGESEGYFCSYYDDAPTKKSQKRTVLVASCVKIETPSKPAAAPAS